MVNWNNINTILLDMDGTLLDLHFDNYFWQHFLPARYAEVNNIEAKDAVDLLSRQFEAKRDSIEWYSTDYWSAELAMDIPALKKEIRHLISERPRATEFLVQLGKQATQRILITNAHRHSLEIKMQMTRIGAHLDAIVSSHDYGVPKEHQAFWHHLQEQIPFDPTRTLFIDDTESMLVAAQSYGISNLLCVSQPDSTKAPRTNLEFPALVNFFDLLPES